MKKTAKRIAAGLLAAAMVVTSVQLPGPAQVQAAEAESGNALRLWYDEPTSKGTNILSAGSGYDATSNYWQQQTLPIGNGDMGANVYGEIASEHLTFNEKTLWTGGPSDSRPNYMGGNLENQGQNGAVMKQIQELFAAGNDSAASQLCNQLTGTSNGYGAYQPWGDIYFDYKDVTDTKATDYERDLDLTTAISSVKFTEDGTAYNREFFISNPDNVFVGYLDAEGSEKLNLDVRFTSKQGATATASGNTLELAGEVSDNQMQFASYLTVVANGGTVTASGSKLTVAGADSIVVYVSAATDYKNDYPEYRTGETMTELKTRVKADVDAAAAKGYDAVKEDHLADYKELFDRVELDLGQTVSEKTTDALLAAYKNDTASEAEKRQLEVMLFQYGRYLTIASSRENSQLPSNLQGVWNCLTSPPWSSDYHMNVNLQMNYWPTYSTNLAECAQPLIDYVDSLREPGRVTAEIYAGVVSDEENPENGFMAHTQNTPFGWTCPGWSFDWGWSPAAVPWILQNCWEYYEYTGDLEYMEEYIYPMLKEEAVLYDQMLVRDEDGKLVSSPSYSPEHGPRTAGNTYEQSLIWQLYEDAITAAELLGVDADKAATWKANQADLKGPIEIGDDGQIKEWYEETTLGSVSGSDAYGHRHLSHMLGLFPGDLIQQDEDWVEAARVSMETRTDNSTGWGMGQRINTWARLGDGNKAHELIGNLFAGGIYPNLWDSHSPFQIDGNFGMTSGVAEMLVQSNMGFIDLLPALPDAWADGSVEGLIARGNFEIDMTWEGTSLTTAVILSNNGGTCEVGYPNIAEATVTDESGKAVAVTETENGVSFETEAGKTYTITEVPERPAKAPQNVSAMYFGSEMILEFGEVLNAASYNVYKSADGETWEKAAEVVEGTTYVEGNYEIGTVYKVAGVVDGREGELSKKIEPKRLALTGKIDDRDSRITYSAGWGNWSDSALYGGTEKYSSVTGDSAEFYFYGNAIRVIGIKSTQVYGFEMIIDGETYGPFDSHKDSGATEKSVLIGEVTDLEDALHKVTLVTTGTKLSLDAFEFDYVAPEGYELEAPENLSALYVGNDMVLTFDAVETADSYNVYECADGENYELKETVETTSYTTGSYSEGFTYKVAAVIDGDEGVLSEAVAPTALELTEKIDDRDERITYSSGWGDWTEAGHYQETQKFTGHGGAGDTVEFYFYGNTVRVLGNKNSDHHTFDVYIDGVKAGSYDANATAQEIGVVLAEVTDLDNGLHKFELVVTQQKISLDAFEFEYEEPVVESPVIPVSVMTATAEDEMEAAANAIDGDTGTVWHTDWYAGDNHDTHWIQFTLSSEYLVDGLNYLPRQSGTNGIITEYKILTSADGETWTEVASGEWAGDSSEKTVKFDPVQTKYIRLKAEAAITDQAIQFASAAEIRLTGVKAPDCEHVYKDVAAKAPTCTEEGYTAHKVCESCGAAVGKMVIEATGHSWGEAVVTKEATCTEAGEETVTCENCDAAEKETIEALGHTWGEWTVVTEPTADAEGEEARTCTACQEVETRAIDKLDPNPAENPFVDVSEADYFYDSVMWAVENNVTTGITEDTFGAYAGCDRAQIVLFLYRALNGEAVDAENPFSDVSEADYCYDAVLWAVENGITNGITATTFEPWKACTRAEIVTFLWRAMGSEKVETDKVFEDVNAADFFYDAVAWAVENGVTTGLNDTSFGAWKNCFRCDAVTFIKRAVSK